MNYFKTDIFRKEFQNFTEKRLPKVLECGLCEKYSCKWPKQILVTCNQCRDARCLPYVTFKSSVVTDFLKISDKTLNNLFKKETNFSKTRVKVKTFDAKVYHKIEKNRIQFVMKTLDDCNKIQYISKRGKHTFYKKP